MNPAGPGTDPKWLHDLDALSSFADGPPGEIRDWANARLALRAPDRVQFLPSGRWDAELAIAAGAPLDPGMDPALFSAMGPNGRLPEDPGPWVEALRPRVLADPTPDGIRALADLGALDGELLVVLSRMEGPAARQVTPGLVLRWAAAAGRPLDPLAVQIAESVSRSEPTLADFVAINTVLGIPRLVVFADGPAEAVRFGSARAGAEFEPPPIAKGSARRRADRMVQAVLEGRSGPAAAWLRAVAALDGVPPDWVCGLAGWCAAYVEGDDPVVAVTGRAGGQDPQLLSRARRAVRTTHVGQVEAALNEPESETPPASALACQLLADRAEGSGRLAQALASRLELTSLPHTLIGLASSPDPLPDWLASQAVGLLFARYLGTEEMLATLLAADASDPALRPQQAWALAEMGDEAAFAAAEAMLRDTPEDPDLAAAVAHGALLLGRRP